MKHAVAIGIVALASLVPATLAALRAGRAQEPASAGRGRVAPGYWAMVAVAAAGSVAAAAFYLGSAWRTGLAPALWTTIAASLVLFLGFAAAGSRLRRLDVLLFPYLTLLAAIAAIWGSAVGGMLSDAAPPTWIAVHVAAAVLTYSLLTLAAIAGVAVLIQERALKAKRRSMLGGYLPSLADSELLQVRLLGAAEAVLLVGLLSGMATNYMEVGRILPLDHKVLFSLGGFVVIGGLLIAHYRTGIRGRRAARFVLGGYLLLTLAFPGVKFVTDVLL
ncbi:MAG: inner membrane protein YpjD [Alphaproteobacteria bacterium]